MSELNGARRLRSREWFDNPDNPSMTALYLERYLNYGLTLEELAIEIQPRVTASSALPGIRLEKLMSVEIEVEVNCRQLLQLRRQVGRPSLRSRSVLDWRRTAIDLELGPDDAL